VLYPVVQPSRNHRTSASEPIGQLVRGISARDGLTIGTVMTTSVLHFGLIVQDLNQICGPAPVEASGTVLTK